MTPQDAQVAEEEEERRALSSFFFFRKKYFPKKSNASLAQDLNKLLEGLAL
jgi:hypothetical protein